MSTVAMTLRAVQMVRVLGVTVTFEPGWETRGNGYALKPVGVLQHHTATPSSASDPFPSRKVLRDGRSNLAGPLCNSAGPADGSVHVMAAQAANHAGASGGRSMGPLPVTTLFNLAVWGHEIDYAGTVPMLDVQYRAAVLWTAALLVAMAEAGYVKAPDPERARAHAETSITGKFDPGYAMDRTYDMTRFRADVARALTGGLTMTSPAAVWTQPLNGTNGAGQLVTFTAQEWLTFGNVYAGTALTRINQTVIPTQSAHGGALAEILDILRGTAQGDAAESWARVEQAAADAAARGAHDALTGSVIPALREVLADVLDDDNREQADAIVDRLASRLTDRSE